MRASGVRPARRPSAAVISTTAAAPSLRPEALPAVTVPSLSKAGRSRPSLRRCAVADVLVLSTTVSPLRCGTVTATISSLNLPAFCAASALFWLATREFVLHLARDLPLLGHVLGRDAHVVAVEGVPQAVLDHGVDHLPVAHLLAGAQMPSSTWGDRLMLSWPPATTISLSPWLTAARQRHRRRPEPQTWLMTSPGRRFLRQAGLDMRLARRVLALPAVSTWPMMTSPTRPAAARRSSGGRKPPRQ
jgi:hypothetical protein